MFAISLVFGDTAHPAVREHRGRRESRHGPGPHELCVVLVEPLVEPEKVLAQEYYVPVGQNRHAEPRLGLNASKLRITVVEHFGSAQPRIKDCNYPRMSGTPNTANLYGPAAPLLLNGATAHVSPYPMASKDFPRDLKGRFTG